MHNLDLRAFRYPPLIDRFLSKIEEPFDVHNDCWVWSGRLDKRGYGRIGAKGKTQLAHRVGYELFVGPIPLGHDLDHLCKNPKCVNPDHLNTLPPSDHYGQGNREKTHCLRGHPFDEANTYLTPSGDRMCRICRRIHDKRRSK